MRHLPTHYNTADSAEDYYAQAREVGARIQAARTRTDMTVAELAAHVGCPLDAIRRIESGRQLPMPPRAQKIMQALGMEEGFFWQGR